jgi:hypothetical protein
MDDVQSDARHGDSAVCVVQSEPRPVESAPHLVQTDQRLVGPDLWRVRLKLRQGGLKHGRVGPDAWLVQSKDVLGRLNLSRVRLDQDHLESAALLFRSDAHVFQSAMDVGGLKLRRVRSKMALVRLKKTQVESAVMGSQSTKQGIQSNEPGFQSAVCLFRVDAGKHRETARDFPSAAPWRLDTRAGSLMAKPGFPTSHLLNTVECADRRGEIFVRLSFSSGAGQATLRSLPMEGVAETIDRRGALSSGECR